jgi:lysophospholipase L1-like esterase
MTLGKLRQQITTMMKYQDPPTFIVIHIGGNDIAASKVGHLRNDVKNVLTWVARNLPNTLIIWSQILPRINWRYSENSDAMERCRYRVNNYVASFVIKNGGAYIRYPEIKVNNTCICSDGVHLTYLGNDVFLSTLQGAIENFRADNNPDNFIFPN